MSHKPFQSESGALTPRIQVIGLTKTFRRVGGDAIKPIDDISLEVGPQEMVLLVGPSGCGKTTLLRCIAGLERPDTGEIILDGRVVFSSAKKIFVPPEERQLSMIFQSYALWPHMSVFENIAYPLESRKVAKHEIAPRVEKVMQMVGIADLGRQFPGRISGGQQQRVALARALVPDSKIVLFDEPLSNVDARVREQLRFEMKRMQRQLRFSGLYVTHDQGEAMELGDRIAVLEMGRIAALGKPKDIYENPNSEYVATFLGTANIWSGEVRGENVQGVLIDTPLGQLLSSTAPDASRTGLSAKQKCKVVVRPERIHLSATPYLNGSNCFEGTVAARSFNGPSTEFHVQCGPALVRVLATQDAVADVLQEGDRAYLSIDPRWIRPLPSAISA